MEGDQLSQHEYIQRVQAAFHDLLNHFETYDAPCETEEQQLAFFESFLRGRALRQTKRQGNLWQNGAYHTPLTFRHSLKDAIGRHGQRNPKTLQDSMAYFFDARSKTFNEKYTHKCKASSEQLEELSASACKRLGRDNPMGFDDEERMTDATMSPAPGKTETSEGSSEGSLAPALKELIGYRGRKPRRIRQQGNGVIKRRSPRRDPVDRDNVKPETNSSPWPRQLIPVIPKQVMPEISLREGNHGGLPELATGERDSNGFRTMRLCRPAKPDRRLIESRMARAEVIYQSLRDILGEGRDDQASFIAEPSWPLQRLYTTALGCHWRTVFARLQEERLAENADIIYALIGAAIYDFVFESATHDPRRSSTASLIAEDTPTALRQDHLSDEELSMIFGLRLSKALDEHMRHQPPQASRPNGFVPQSLERELALIFAEALALKQDMLATGADVAYGWHPPGQQYDIDTMNTRVSHAAPPLAGKQACSVALCFLPSVKSNEDHHILYRAQVKVAAGEQ